MRTFLLIALFWTICGTFSAQSLTAIEDSIAFYHNIVRTTSNDEIRVQSSEKMKGFFMDAFTFPETFEYPFSKLNFCKIISSDGRVRLINWNVSLLDGTHNYVCYVLLYDTKTKTYSWTELMDTARQTDKVETKFLTPEKWYGTLYYEIIPLGKKKKKIDSYTLLGWDGNDQLTTRKVIDVLKINNGKLKFGEEIFKSDLKHAKRIIYEYSDEVSASVKYYVRKNHIVVDHLAPRNPIMQGVFADYGPDGTYDRWSFVEGKWVFEDNIDVTIYTEDDKRPFNLPKD
jgi:hypothetical protein